VIVADLPVVSSGICRSTDGAVTFSSCQAGTTLSPDASFLSCGALLDLPVH
jgi:hypothetical protein